MKRLIESLHRGERKQKRRQWQKRPRDFGREMQGLIMSGKNKSHFRNGSD